MRRLAHLCLVLTSSALEGVCLQVGDGNEATQVADMHPVGIRSSVESLMKELRCSVSYLTVSLHLTESKTTITERVK